MGIWNFLTGGTYATPTTAPALASPWSPQDSLQTAIVGELFGVDPSIVTREIAQRVPGLARAVQVHADIVSTMPLVAYEDGQKLDAQPRWLSNTQTGIAPLIRTKGLVQDLFWDGWALLGFTAKPVDEPDCDALHIPRSLWKFRPDGQIEVNGSISKTYTRYLVAIPLGRQGVMVDGVDTIRAARALELSRQNRIAAPPAATEIHLTDPRFDEMTRPEKLQLARDYSESRRETSVSVTPSYAQVEEHGGQAVDLFSSATNDLRLDQANHASVPASIIEGATSGGGSAITYSNKGSERNEIYDLGSRQFADAIAARLSLDDVTPSGTYLAFDRSDSFSVPTPTTPPVLED